MLQVIRLLLALIIVLTCQSPSSAQTGVDATNGPIAFQSSREGNSEIYVMNADGSAQTRLTNNLDPDTQPAWSPDGTKIAFVSARDGAMPAIFLMNADGTEQTRLSGISSPNFGSGDAGPAWSPDGRKIAFSRCCGGGGEFIY